MKNKMVCAMLALSIVNGSLGMSVVAAQTEAVAAEQEAPEETEAATDDAEETEASDADSEGVRSKDETVYVIEDAQGTAEQVIVSDRFENVSAQEAQDSLSDLTDLENVKGDDCWQGNSDQELPVQTSISYTLDGEEITPQELAGKSGHVTILFDYTNTQFETREIDGEQQDIYVPFVVITGALFDNDNFTNVQITNGKVLTDGDRTIAVGAAFPGMQQTLGIGEDTLDIPDSIEISADVTDFSLDLTLSLMTNSIFSSMDTEDLEQQMDLGSIEDQVTQITDAMQQLEDGAGQLSDGLASLLENCNTLSEGMTQLSDGLDTLNENSDSLNEGAKQVFEALLSEAATQLQAAGLDVSELTIDNYDSVLASIETMAKTAAALSGSSDTSKLDQLEALRNQLDSYNEFYNGLAQYTAGVSSAAAGADSLEDNMPALIEGVTSLGEGAQTLSDGITTFDQEAVSKITDLLTSDVPAMKERIQAILEVSGDYSSFAGTDESIQSSVKFICRTTGISAEGNEEEAQTDET